MSCTSFSGSGRVFGVAAQQLSSLCPLITSISAKKPRYAAQKHFSRHFHRHCITISNISQLERPAAAAVPAPTRVPQRSAQPLPAYEIIKGAIVRYSSDASVQRRPPPTAVLIHGILGSRRNMQSFAKRLVEGFPAWQVVLVDLRCHGDSAPLFTTGPHGVDTAAGDVLRLLSALKLFPEILIGHSFGGKVVMSMAHQFGTSAGRLPRPVRVWSLDSLPGEVRSGEMGAADRPVDLITILRRAQLPIASRSDLISKLESAGFSSPVAAWAASNLTPFDPENRSRGYTWSFDLDGIAQMYESYEKTDLWPLLMAPAQGINISFVKAERSTFRWGGRDEERILFLGHDVHELPNSGHWVHTDNPDALFGILAPSFGASPDIHMQRRQST